MMNTYSIKGNSHRQNEDVVFYETFSDYVVMGICDGVSSCLKGKEGAKKASQEVLFLLKHYPELFFKIDMNHSKNIILSHVYYGLKQLAKKENHHVNDYSSTLLIGLYHQPSQLFFYFNLGDGMILEMNDLDYQIISRPSNSEEGCYVTTTAHVQSKIDSGIIQLSKESTILMMSDGLWSTLFQTNRLTNQSLSSLHHPQLWIEKSNFEDDASLILFKPIDKEGEHGETN